MQEFIISVGVVVICVVIAVMYLYPRSTKVTTVPGLDASDEVLGNLPDLQKAGSLHQFLMILHKNYGDIVSFWFGQQLVVSIASPRLFKQHSKVFNRPPLLFKYLESFITPESIQYCNGDEARQRHVAYGRCYSDQAMRAYYPTINKLADELVQKWGNTPPEEHIALHETCYDMAVSVMLQCSLDKHLLEDSIAKKLRKNYDVAWSALERGLVEGDPEEGSDSEKTFQKGHKYRTQLAAKKTFTDTLKKVLEDYKNNLPTEVKTTLIDVLSRSDLSEAKTVADLLTAFVGGFHTSGSLMNFTLYFLATHPDVEQKLSNEIQQVLGVDESGNQCKVTPENIDQLVYLRQVLEETLRISIVAPYAARFEDVESELGGHRIPAGTPVIHALGVVLQSEDLYPDPTKFDPERFSPENRKKLPPFAFEPFGFAGKRKCFGWKFGFTENTIVMAAIVGHFKLSMVPGQKWESVYGLNTKPSKEIWITVTKRN